MQEQKRSPTALGTHLQQWFTFRCLTHWKSHCQSASIQRYIIIVIVIIIIIIIIVIIVLFINGSFVRKTKQNKI